jgi:transposase
VVNPADVPTSHKEKEFKTDPRDCMKIARSLRSNLLDSIYIHSDEGLEARQVVRTYFDFSKNYTRYKNKIKALLNFYGIDYPEEFKSETRHWSANFFLWLQGIQLKGPLGDWSFQFYVQQCLESKALKQKARKQVQALSKTLRFNHQTKLLQSIPGIGLISAMIVLTEIEDIHRFRSVNQLCSYMGLVPSTNSSGEKERVGEITNRGNKNLKGTIVECAWMAIRSDSHLLLKYTQLRKRMEKNKAIVRIARKLVAGILFVLIIQKEYIKK